MTFKIIELFAGVGGFRIGFERANFLIDEEKFKVVWSNQWEPNEKSQHASKVYVARCGTDNHSNEDISKVSSQDIPDNFDILVGGFPCQDYSVARTLNQAQGISGKKGVLWWDIHRILHDKRPSLVILENVDRLLGSPASQRGRDFAMILASMNDLGYAVEWRVINAAEYGFPQRRKRTFILGYLNSTNAFKEINSNPYDWIAKSGVLAKGFKCNDTSLNVPMHPTFVINGDLPTITESFNKSHSKVTPFQNTGLSINREVLTFKSTPKHDGNFFTLGDTLINETDVPEEYFINNEELDKWFFHKNAKSIIRTKKDGTQYSYDEGPVSFPDSINKPSRTIITGEGGKSASRFKHVVLTSTGKYRRLTPVELERLNGFPDNHTKIDSVSDTRRAFFMGNALVTGVVTRIAQTIYYHPDIIHF